MTLNLILSVPTSINPDGVHVRSVGEQDSPLFCLADVCRTLGLSNPSHVGSRLDPDEKGIILSDTPSGKQEMVYVNEAGFYRVVMRSDKPAAKAFSRWVCHEVLPCIRKHGCYPAPAAQPQQQPDVLAQLASVVLDLRDRVVRMEAKSAPVAPQFVPTGGVVGIMEQVRKLWRTANEKQRNRCVARVRAVCMQRGIVVWKPLDNGPLALPESQAHVINDVVNEIRELDESPLFSRFASRQAGIVN